MTSSTPTFSEFNPSAIPFQDTVVDDILCQYDYSLGTHEVLLSGSVGSAKSILAAHLAVRHCFDFPGARFLLGRKALPQLRETIYTKIVEHLDMENFKEGRDYFLNDTVCSIRFRNKSEIVSTSWADKKFSKIRSYEVSSGFIEEGSENDEKDSRAYSEILMRCGRLKHVPHKWLMVATNPDSPGHWLYKRFFQAQNNLRHVYLSKTEDNPFLPREYIEGLKANLDPKMARRMLFGEWVELDQERIYHAYSREKNFRNESYKYVNAFPIQWSWDLNIGAGKPMSSCFGQYIGDTFHFGNEIIVEGARTEDVLEEAADRGYLDYPTIYEINGDASGKHNDTRSKLSDYDIIKKFLSNYKNKAGEPIRFRMNIPMANPPIRKRHNIVNAYCENSLGEVRLFVYKDAPTVDEGLRLSQLKKGADIVEDDSKRFQHVSTSVGYMINAVAKRDVPKIHNSPR